MQPSEDLDYILASLRLSRATNNLICLRQKRLDSDMTLLESFLEHTNAVSAFMLFPLGRGIALYWYLVPQ
jgi:hypothetical protein